MVLTWYSDTVNIRTATNPIMPHIICVGAVYMDTILSYALL